MPPNKFFRTVELDLIIDVNDNVHLLNITSIPFKSLKSDPLFFMREITRQYGVYARKNIREVAEYDNQDYLSHLLHNNTNRFSIYDALKNFFPKSLVVNRLTTENKIDDWREELNSDYVFVKPINLTRKTEVVAVSSFASKSAGFIKHSFPSSIVFELPRIKGFRIQGESGYSPLRLGIIRQIVGILCAGENTVDLTYYPTLIELSHYIDGDNSSAEAAIFSMMNSAGLLVTYKTLLEGKAEIDEVKEVSKNVVSALLNGITIGKEKDLLKNKPKVSFHEVDSHRVRRLFKNVEINMPALDDKSHVKQYKKVRKPYKRNVR
jgi:hypothetical protein